MVGLRVAPDLVLPRETVVEKQAILAMSGAGKSNTAVVLAEAMYDAGLPWVAIDPKGDWWGIRSGRDGKAPGLPVPIFGGIHGDVPLEPTAGALIANLIAARRLTCVLDVSEFDTRQQLFRFLADFAETLLKRNTEPLHVFAEEADDYLPQRTAEKGELPRCLGAWQRLVKRGRQRGIGSTLITQRSSAINKDVLNMTDTLIVMRTTAPLDRKAITGWVETHDGHVDLVDSLPSLADGEAWVWSPQKLKLTKRVTFARRRTYDSGATPLLDSKAKVATLADVDLGALREEMADTIERVQADDPALLRKRIRTLEAELRKRPTETVVEEREVIVEVVPEWVAEALLETVGALDFTIKSVADDLHHVRTQVAEVADKVASGSEPARAKGSTARKPVAAPPAQPVARRTSAERGGLEWTASQRVIDGDVKLKAGARRMLAELAAWPNGLTDVQLSMRARVKRSGGSWSTYLSTLRTAGLIADGGVGRVATDAGREYLGVDPPAPRTPTEVRETWLRPGLLKAGARRMLQVLIDAYPEAVSKDDLSARAEIDTAGGSWSTYLSTLRSNDLLTEPERGFYLASEELID